MKTALLLSETYGIEWRTLGGHSGDQGIDLRGWWRLPDQTSHYIIGQCKRTKWKIPTPWIRDFEAVLASAPQTIGFFIASTKLTSESIKRWKASNYPMAFFHMPIKTSDPGVSGTAVHLASFSINLALQKLLPKLTILQGSTQPGPSLERDHPSPPLLVLYDGVGLASPPNPRLQDVAE